MAKGQNVHPENGYARRLLLSYRLTRRVVERAISALQPERASVGLDVGCGTGHHTVQLARAIAPGGKVTGVDTSPAMIDCASEAAQKGSIPETVDFRKADIFDLPFDDGSFDWVFCKDTLWPGSVATGLMGRTPVAAVKELARVVRPGGTIALLFWSSQMFLPGYPSLEARLMAAFSEKVSYLADIEPDRHFLRAMGWLQAAGLEDIGVRCFSDCVHAPLDKETREAVHSCIKMFFEDVDIRTIVSNEDWTAYRRLVDPKSKEYILDRSDYYCFLTYSMFSGIAPSKQR